MATSRTDMLLVLGLTALGLYPTSCSAGHPGSADAQGGGPRDAGTTSRDASMATIRRGIEAGMANDAKVTRSAEPSDSGSARAASSFRVTELYLRDPHFFVAGVDITDQPLLGMSVNGSLIPGGLTMDNDGDGFLDLSALGIFQPLDPASVTGPMDLIDAHCPNGDPTHCTSDPQPTLKASLTIENHAQGSCLDPVPGTTSNFSPTISLPTGPCFGTTQAVDLVFNLGGIDVGMTAARIAATYEGKPTAALVNGLIIGFVTDANAMRAVLPSYLGAPLAGSSISSYLRDEDRDKSQSPTGEDGWWVYLNFVAKPVEYTP